MHICDTHAHNEHYTFHKHISNILVIETLDKQIACKM